MTTTTRTIEQYEAESRAIASLAEYMQQAYAAAREARDAETTDQRIRREIREQRRVAQQD